MWNLLATNVLANLPLVEVLYLWHRSYGLLKPFSILSWSIGRSKKKINFLQKYEIHCGSLSIRKFSNEKLSTCNFLSYSAEKIATLEQFSLGQLNSLTQLSLPS